MKRLITAAALVTTFGLAALASAGRQDLRALAAPRSPAGRLRLTTTGTLSAPDLSVLAFHNDYSVGKQGGIEIIHEDERIATNGRVVVLTRGRDAEGRERLQPSTAAGQPTRVLDTVRDTITVPFEHRELSLRYAIVVAPEADGFRVSVDLERPLDLKTTSLRFEIELYPGAFRGGTFQGDADFGVLPWDFGSALVEQDGTRGPRPLARGRRLLLAQPEPGRRLEITSEAGPLQLSDGRFAAPHYWFEVAAEARPGATAGALVLHFRPQRNPLWRRKPVIAHAQVGYRPAQDKRAVLELDPRTRQLQPARLERLDANGRSRTVLTATPKRWGPFLRYEYASFDFSAVREPGLYRLAYGGTTTLPFRIADDVYRDGVWQPVVETFLPVQMCHMKVKDRGRLWHGACHLDDGLQAKAPLPFFDGFAQSAATGTAFAPDTTIPGLAVGGWHDAGDDDINTGSTGRTAYHLALLAEEFGAGEDQTTIDFERRQVELHRPDGKPDVLQQLVQGVRWLLAPYRAGNHSFVGVISHDWETYLQAGDWSGQTDGLLYDPKLGRDERTADHSGRADDRYVFTDEDSRSEYFVAGTLAASQRALRGFDPALAEECLRVARSIWARQQALPQPAVYPSVGTPESLVEERTNAAVELFLSTGEPGFLDAIVRDREAVLAEVSRTAWTLSRVEAQLGDRSFRDAFDARLAAYSRELGAKLASNPFGTPLDPQVWGYGWNILWQAWKHYYLVKAHRELFPLSQLSAAVEYTLGRHPGSDLSLVSSVSSHRPIPAFGINRADYGHIPGGVYSGVALVLPDFPELKDDHPFLWQQSEYIVFGATPFAFCVLGVDKLLSEAQER